MGRDQKGGAGAGGQRAKLKSLSGGGLGCSANNKHYTAGR